MGNQSASASASHKLPDASDGIRQSPLGLSVTEPTFGPSWMHERLNCCWKNRRQNIFSQCRITASEYLPPYAYFAIRNNLRGREPKRSR